MNVALISDLHLGCKKNSDVFLNNHIKYLTDEFIPYLKKHGINYIFILGDIYDNRNSINIKVKNAIYDLFEQQFKDFNVYMIVGNHDTYFKTSIDTHSLKFFKKFENITVIDDVERIELNNKKILMVPWQTDNEQFIQFSL
jgi:DNA repair exonuclease SbcCD nuclease subunit